MTFQEAYNMELGRAENTTCPHGSRLDMCPSSMCHIWTPEDMEVDPDQTLTEGEREAFEEHLNRTYGPLAKLENGNV